MIDLFYTVCPHPRAESRAFLARVLARCGVPPSQQRIVCGAHGKPALEGGGVHFNISHSGTLLLAAVAPSPVGADVQRTGRVFPAVFARLTPQERREDFFRLWTAKEAYVKYCGGSLAAMLPRLTFEEGVLCDGGVPIAQRLLFGTLEGCALCVCSAEEEYRLLRV